MPAQLCRQCSEIPLEPDMKTLCSPEYDDVTPSWYLGTFGEVKARDCPFCELVASMCTKDAESWEAPTPPDDSHKIIVRWGRDSFYADCFRSGCCICVVKDSKDTEIYYARTKFGEFIDLDYVRGWLSTCDREHKGSWGECCPTKFNPAILPRVGKRQLDLRMIDVETMCIVYAPSECRYIALSYVWGSRAEASLVLTSHNEETLMQPGALSNAELPIPTTIKDAVTVVRKLRERYLWVDSLCLLQDDVSELNACVSIMDLFYEMSILTIVAADGADAWAGLQGVEPTPRHLNRMVREISPVLKMTTMRDFDGMLRRSPYSTRGWTMQEEVVSPRILAFVDGQVYYHCSGRYYSEVLNWRGKPLHDQGDSIGSAFHGLFDSATESDFEDFSTMLMYYKLRKLSYQSDILRAAQGMLRKFSISTGLHCFEGLPAPLDRSLLFHSSTAGSNAMFGRRESFPSYSWTGWKNGSEYPKCLQETGPVIICDPTDGDFIEGEVDLRGWIIWHCRLEDGNICRITDTGRLQKSLHLKAKDSTCKARWRFQEIPVSITDVDFETPSVNSYPLLLFWTICINLPLKKSAPTHENPTDLANYEALDKNGKSCGMVHMDAAVPEMGDGKFALLAADDAGIWALMLMWKDGIAERRGVVHLPRDVIDVCLPPGPRWEAIVLG